ncbi:MAG: hypothetical protein ACM3MD_10530 [Betaproteobacteria bacterium]
MTGTRSSVRTLVKTMGNPAVQSEDIEGQDFNVYISAADLAGPPRRR